MPVIDSRTDTDTLTFTVVADLAASPERAWQLWADKTQLEGWWGPPQWPATFDRHELVPGGECRYHMTGPDGTRAPGWWQVQTVDAPTHLSFHDGFAGDDGEPVDPDDHTVAEVTLAPHDGGTRMTIVSRFRSAEQLETMVGMGMQEGIVLALGQADALLAA